MDEGRFSGSPFLLFILESPNLTAWAAGFGSDDPARFIRAGLEACQLFPK
jgi:hypothetical protein